jgi:hypothetical protein
LKWILVLIFMYKGEIFPIMADHAQPLDRNGAENRGRMKVEKSSSRRQIPGVDFEELNFEQRRMPYDGQRTIASDNSPEGRNGKTAPGPND